MIHIFEEITGINQEGFKCHPFRGLKGQKKGFFSYTLSTDNKSFRPASESELKALVLSGAFEGKGRIRMIPKGAKTTASAGALSVRNHKLK